MVNNGYQMIQAIEIQPGLYGVSTGTFDRVQVIRCLEDGDITITFRDGSQETVSMTAISDAAVDGLTVTIVSGSFALNR